MKIKVIGSAISRFGELWNFSLEDLIKEVVEAAVINSNIEVKDIEAVFIANKAAGNYQNQHHLNALVSQMLPHFPPAMRIEGACASGSLALLAAEYGLLSGRFSTVLVVGAEKMTDVSAEETTQILAGAANARTEWGSTFPALYALLAKVYQAKYGLTRDCLSSVVVKNHHQAMFNPKAQYHKEFTLDQVAQSSLIADPLRLLDCSPISDGAAAVVLTTKKVNGHAEVVGFGQGQDSIDLANRRSLTSLMATKKAMKTALSQAKISQADIQAAEVHDCFSIAEIMAIEDLGFFEPGNGAIASFEGETSLGGKLVVNPSGGLKACGHPVGATGVKQVAYLTQQIQKGRFDSCLAHNVGGSGATAVVHILQKDSRGRSK